MVLGAKNPFSNSEKSELADRLALLLSVQLLPSPTPPSEGTKIEVKKGRINRKAIGYIYGFVDSGLQCREQNITDIDVGLPILFHVLRTLFPGREQAYVDFLMHHMEDEIVVLGMMVGGQEYYDFLHSNGSPMGLARLILEYQED